MSPLSTDNSWGSLAFNSPVDRGSEVGVGNSTPLDSSKEGSGDFSLTDVSQMDSPLGGKSSFPSQQVTNTRDVGCQTEKYSNSNLSKDSQTSPFKVNLEFRKEIRTFSLEQLSRVIAEVAEDRA